MKKELMKKILMWSIVAIAIMSILVMAGETEGPATLSEIIIPKVVAMGTFIGSVLFGRYAQRRGWFPKGEKPFVEENQ